MSLFHSFGRQHPLTGHGAAAVRHVTHGNASSIELRLPAVSPQLWLWLATLLHEAWQERLGLMLTHTVALLYQVVQQGLHRETSV